MINVDDRLLISGITADQLYLLLHISKYMNKDMTCFPSNASLCLSTAWGLTKLKEVKRSLVVDGYLSITERKNGEFQLTNLYTIETEHLSVWVNLKGKGGEEQEVGNAAGGRSETRPGEVVNATTEVLTNKVLNTTTAVRANFDLLVKRVAESKGVKAIYKGARGLNPKDFGRLFEMWHIEAEDNFESYENYAALKNHFLNYASRVAEIERKRDQGPQPAADPTKNLKRFV